MDSLIAAFHHPVLTLGPIAEELVAESGVGEIEAVFCSTFYIRLGRRDFASPAVTDRQSDGHYLCMGHSAVAPGPLNCITAASANIDWRACGLKRGMKAGVAATGIKVGSRFSFPLTPSSRTRSMQCQLSRSDYLDPHTLARGVAVFRQAAAGRSDISGLGLFLDPEFQPQPHHYCCLAAHGPLIEARRWLLAGLRSRECATSKNTAWIEQLSGLGPGLTPSGDDFLGGMMVALNYLEEQRLNDILWPEVRGQVCKNSNAISLAHLSAAARGLQSAAIDHAITAITIGSSNQIEQAMDGIARIGHSSGWDIMTGIVTTLEGWLQSTESRKPQLQIH